MQDEKSDPRATATGTPRIGPDHQLPPPHRHGGIRILVWLIILLAFAAGGTVTLTTATAHEGSIGVYVDAIGTVTPVHTVTVNAQVTGTITQVLYKEGQIVHQGQQLIQIDPRPFQANVLNAQGALDRDTNLLAQAQMDLKR
jgi:multidrug efflux system membrane fusion protein